MSKSASQGTTADSYDEEPGGPVLTIFRYEIVTIELNIRVDRKIDEEVRKIVVGFL